MNALHTALRNGDLDTVRKCLETGTDLDELDSFGETGPPDPKPPYSPFMLYRGYTALTWTLEQRHLLAAALLLEAGADPNCQDARNNQPLMIAVKANDPQMVELLLKHGADPNWHTNIVGSCTSVTVLDLLVRFGADMNREDEEGRTPIFYQLYGPNDHEVLPRMLFYGAKLNHEGHGGRTPIIEALDEWNGRSVALHIDCGADTSELLESEWREQLKEVLERRCRPDLLSRLFSDPSPL